MKFSIIVSDTISQGGLVPCLQALCAQDHPADDYEVLLPDLGDITIEEAHFLSMLEKDYPHLRILRGATGMDRRTERMDAAAREAKGEYLVFIESHCIAPRGWLSAYDRFLKKENSPGLVLGRFKTIPMKSRVGQAEEAMRERVVARFQEKALLGHYFDFHNSAIRKDLYLQAGGLLHELPVLGEFELGARLVEQGHPIRPLPESCVAHINDSALRTYALIVEKQGRDRIRVLFLRGPEFLAKYFPSPQVVGRLTLLRALRLPLMAALFLYKWAAAGAFRLAAGLGLRRAGVACFASFATTSNRLGQLIGLGDARRLARVPLPPAPAAVPSPLPD